MNGTWPLWTLWEASDGGPRDMTIQFNSHARHQTTRLRHRVFLTVTLQPCLTLPIFAINPYLTLPHYHRQRWLQRLR